MMNRHFLTLDDGSKYLVISRVNYKGITYCFVGRLDDSSIYKYAKIINDEIEFIDDEDIIKEIKPLLLKNLPNS